MTELQMRDLKVGMAVVWTSRFTKVAADAIISSQGRRGTFVKLLSSGKKIKGRPDELRLKEVKG